MMVSKNWVVQFNEKHKWRGSLGIVEEVENGRILIGVPIPEKGTAYIFAKESEIEYIGQAVLIPQKVE